MVVVVVLRVVVVVVLNVDTVELVLEVVEDSVEDVVLEVVVDVDDFVVLSVLAVELVDDVVDTVEAVDDVVLDVLDVDEDVLVEEVVQAFGYPAGQPSLNTKLSNLAYPPCREKSASVASNTLISAAYTP